MRRAFNLLKMGRPGPVMVEIPADVAVADVAEQIALELQAGEGHEPGGQPARHRARPRGAARGAAAGDPRRAGRAVRRGDVAELLRARRASADPGHDHARGQERLPGGSSAGARHRRRRRHVRPGRITSCLEAGPRARRSAAASRSTAWRPTSRRARRIIHATNDERDLNKNYTADHPILGDAKLVLRQFIDAVKRPRCAATRATAACAERDRSRPRRPG